MTGKINRNTYREATNRNSSYSVVMSVPLPQCADEIRFRLFTASPASCVAYSFNPYFDGLEECNTGNKLPADIVNWVPFVDNDDAAIFGISIKDSGFICSEEVIIRKPSSLGKNIYFFCPILNSNNETWAAQYTIIGGENKNGY